MAVQKTTELERVRYWQGQLLASGDLETQLRVDQEIRRLHNRAVHQAYGIAIGLELELGAAGNLNLTCGMAYDCAGRELIVQSNRAIPKPPQFPMTLVLTRDQASVDGITLTWKAPQAVNPNTEVAITTLIGDASNPTIDPTFREVVARPLARPRLATGQTIPGETTWQPWTIEGTEVGVKVLIDTSAEGFTRPPHYFAEVLPGKPTADFVPAWFASIADPSTAGFTFQLMLRRITRESLDMADPKAQVSATPKIDDLNVNLDQGGLLFQSDFVARLLPIAEQAAVIKTLTGGNATLDFALQDLTTAKQVAFGNPPRVGVVQTVSATPAFEVTVDTPENFAESNVVVKLNPVLGHNATRVVSIDDTDTMEFFPSISGLNPQDTLGIVQSGSLVKSADGVHVEVADVGEFVEHGVVVLVNDPVESSGMATVVKIDHDTNMLQLAAPIFGLANGSFLSTARPGGKVQTATTLPNEVKVKVKNTITQFRAGDLVAKRFADGTFSPPVRVKGVAKSSLTMTLNGSISGLQAEDTIAAADFRVRATVLAQSAGTPPPVTTVNIADSKVFSVAAFVAQIDDLLSASIPVPIRSIATSHQLELAGTIPNLKAGDVIGLCSFPATVEVTSIQDDASIVVSNGALLKKSDVVTAMPALTNHTGLALVADVTGNVVRLAGAIQGLAAGDQLSVATVRGAIEAIPGTSPTKVLVNPLSLRVGDFLADITGWLQPRQGDSSYTYVSAVSGNQITLFSRLDGLLKNDTVGLASSNTLSSPLLRLRLNKPPTDLLVGDEVLLLGLDRLQGKSQTLSARVALISRSTNIVFLWVEGALGGLTFRPEDISASVLFVRGSAMALIQKHDLFVSWLAVGEPDQMPRSCAGTDLSDDPCAGTDEADCQCSQS